MSRSCIHVSTRGHSVPHHNMGNRTVLDVSGYCSTSSHNVQLQERPTHHTIEEEHHCVQEFQGQYACLATKYIHSSTVIFYSVS